MVVINTITTNQQTKLTNGCHKYDYDKPTDETDEWLSWLWPW